MKRTNFKISLSKMLFSFASCIFEKKILEVTSNVSINESFLLILVKCEIFPVKFSSLGDQNFVPVWPTAHNLACWGEDLATSAMKAPLSVLLFSPSFVNTQLIPFAFVEYGICIPGATTCNIAEFILECFSKFENWEDYFPRVPSQARCPLLVLGLCRSIFFLTYQ